MSRGGPGATRTRAAGRGRGRGPSPRSRSARLRPLLVGERPYVLGLMVLVILLALMTLGPLESLSTASDRVDRLETQREQYTAAIEELEQRRAALQRPEEIEMLARGRHGLVRPGEIPFVVVTPEPELEVGPESVEPRNEDLPWYRRLGRSLSELFN
jgi:cell division protein FtsB